MTSRFQQWREARRESREWAATQSLDDVGRMTQKWLRGEVQETPGHGGPPDPETEEIRDDLLKFNERGFVTHGSQPGSDWSEGYDGELWLQRAFVDGCARPEVAARIKAVADAEACEECGDGSPVVDVRTQPVADFRHWWERDDRPSDAVTLRGDVPVTALPPSQKKSFHEFDFGGVGGGAYDEIQQSTWVTAVDNHWGSRRHLWDTIGRALERGEVDDQQQR